MSLLVFAPVSGLAEEATRPSFTCRETVSTGVLGAVSPEGEFSLANGTVARLADIRLAPEETASARAASWLGTLAGSMVRLREVAPADRWGRASALIELTGAAPIDVAELLVSEGLAVVDAGQRDILCRPELLRAEANARRNQLGLWREGPWPIPASAVATLESAAGSFAVIQGRVVSIGERRERTYLNFGRDWSRDLTVTIPRRTWTDLKSRGITAETLRGRIVRVRGTLEVRRGPTLDLTVPDMLELVEASAGRSGKQ